MGWTDGIYNTIGWGKNNPDGDNLFTEAGEFFFYENEDTTITQSPTYDLNGWGSFYGLSWSGQTKLSR